MQALVLDLDDTLLDDRSAVRVAFSAFVNAHRRQLSTEPEADSALRWSDLARRHWQAFERGEISFAEQRRARVREFLGRSFSDAEADAAFEPYRRAYEAAWALVPEGAEFLQRTAGVPKVVITNGEREQQRRKIEACGLAPHLLAVITPADCGFWKPHPGIFQAALKALDADPASCLTIGDDPAGDIAPAQALGMKTFLVESGNPRRTLLDAIREHWPVSSKEHPLRIRST